MIRPSLAAALTLSLSTAVAAAQVAPSPYTATRLGNKLRSVRIEHCERKADGVRVQGQARDVYMRRCTRG